MFCSTCGGRLKLALSYCNHCGANLSAIKPDGKSETAETTTDSLLWVIVGTTITLLGMALGALVLMKNGSIHEGLGIAFVILTFVSLGWVEGVLLWRLLRQNKRSEEARSPAQPEDLSTKDLEPASPRALSEPAESMPSVTEQTTRDLETSHRKSEHR